MKQTRFSDQIVRWYDSSGRKNLPWQTNNPYHTWVSEIMLQQTQVVKVKDYFQRFVTHFPALQDLASAEEEAVLAMWSGLGYYNRARNLHKAARICVAQHNGSVPNQLEQLLQLPGIGRSTAGAILSLAFQQPVSILDGNVKRFFSRYFRIDGEPNKASTLKQFWQVADAHMSKQSPREYNQALMDIGATICTRSQPKCKLCPVSSGCKAKKHDVIDQYPNAKKAIMKKNMDIYVQLSAENNKVLLEKRVEKGIWQNLWFLPTFDSLQFMQEHLSKDAYVSFSIQHVLTHRILNIHVVEVFAKEDGKEKVNMRWLSIDKLDACPHPIALEKVLQVYENSQLH